MPLDRLPWRIFVVSALTMVLFVAAGCHSTMVQPVTGKLGNPAPNQVSASNPRPAEPRQDSGASTIEPKPMTATNQTPPTPDGLGGSPPSVVTLPEGANRVAQDLTQVALGAPAPVASLPGPSSDTPAPILTEPPISLQKKEVSTVVQVDPKEWEPRSGDPLSDPPSGTPMLDAALKLAQTGDRLTMQSLTSTSSEPDGKEVKAQSKATVPPMSPPKPSAVPPVDPNLVKASKPSEPPAKLVGPSVPPQPLENPLKELLPSEGEQVAFPKTPPLEDRFEINNARLCRRVLTFGSTDKLKSEHLKAGQTVVLYAELEGLKDQKEGDRYLSRLESGIRCFPKTSGPIKPDAEPLWKQDFGTVDDTCEQRRRDFYVNYRVTVPKSVKPGEYTLELSVTDLISQRGAKTSISVIVEP